MARWVTLKPAPFLYERAASTEEAVALLAEHGDEARPLAGGQSLLPLMNFRLARPSVLVDLNRVAELDYVRDGDGGVRLGALTRQRTIERSELVRDRAPLLAEATRLVGHFQIRNRGTIGGSIAHADPAAEYPAVAVALRAELVRSRSEGERAVAAEDFFRGAFRTALEPGELLTEVRFPPAPGRTAFLEIARRHGDFAIAGVAARVEVDSGRIRDVGLALAGVGGTPIRAREAEDLLRGEQPGEELFAAAARAAAAAASPSSDIHGTAEYRRSLVATLTARALQQATDAQGGGGS